MSQARHQTQSFKRSAQHRHDDVQISMKKVIMLAVTHTAALVSGFAGGIYVSHKS
jgi:hypothetical protein